MKILIGLLAILLLFGCVGEREPVINETNESEGPPPVTIIIEEQQNQTTEGEGVPEEPTEENETEISTDATYEYEPDLPFGIFFIDIAGKTEHGNSILIKKGDLDILIDAGPKEKGNEVVDFLNSRSVDDIELLISTNADPRNYGGIETVIENFEIEHFWWNGGTFGDQEYILLTDEIKESVKEHEIVEEGFSKEYNGIQIEIIGPPMAKFDDINNDAIVTKLTNGNTTILLLSGLQKGGVQKLTNEKSAEIKAQIIQAPYYGLGEGTKDITLFLLAAKPEVMIITGSADDSPANGGSREPYIRAMEQHGIAWNTTYDNGTLRVTSDGSDYIIQNVSSN